MKANIYVDGFNLYYGCLKGSPHKWLDLGKLCQLLLLGDSINRIRYFTARISATHRDPRKHVRQQVYLRALQTLPNLTVHYGHYLSHSVRMPLATPSPGAPRMVNVLKTEEKGSDVNLATYLLLDAFDNDCEMAVVVSNDSDLRFPIEVVRTGFGVDVGVFNPHPNPSRALQAAASFYRPIRTGVLRASQFPSTLTDRHGSIVKPHEW